MKEATKTKKRTKNKANILENTKFRMQNKVQEEKTDKKKTIQGQVK